MRQLAPKLLPKYAYESFRIFGPNLKSLSLKLRKNNFNEFNGLLCHITGSAQIDPLFKSYTENTIIYQNLKFFLHMTNFKFSYI